MNKQNDIFYKIKKAIGKVVANVFGILIEIIDGKIVFFDPHKIKGVAALEASYQSILEEYIALQKSIEIPSLDEFFVEQKVLVKDKSWRSFPFFIFGIEYADNTAKCPLTRKALLNIEGMSAAMFSILKAGKKIPPHRGHYKGILRLHLALVIPATPNCFIEVNGERKTWQTGKCIGFDDTHLHFVENHADSDRVVLFIDVVRPLPFPLNKINQFIFNRFAKSAYIADAVKGFEKFNNFKTSNIRVHF